MPSSLRRVYLALFTDLQQKPQLRPRKGRGGGIQSRKGYQLWPDCHGAVGGGGGGCTVIMNVHREL